MATLIENINRIFADKEAIKTAIINKGIPVPDGTSLDQFASLISSINSGVDTSVVTATADDVLVGKVIVDADGNEITGTAIRATGNAGVGDVLSGKTFSNSSGSGTGTIPVRSSSTHLTNSDGRSVFTRDAVASGDAGLWYITNSDNVTRLCIGNPAGYGYFEENVVYGVKNTTLASLIGLSGDKMLSGNNVCGIAGTLPYRGTNQQTGGVANCVTGAGDNDGYVAFNQIPSGYYDSEGNSWAPEIRATPKQVRDCLGITASKILSGQSICGVNGTGKRIMSTTVSASPLNNSFFFYPDFIPSMAFVILNPENTLTESSSYFSICIYYNGKSFSAFRKSASAYNVTMNPSSDNINYPKIKLQYYENGDFDNIYIYTGAITGSAYCCIIE